MCKMLTALLTLAKSNGHRVTLAPNCQRHWVTALYIWPGSWSGNRKAMSDFRFRLLLRVGFSVKHVDLGELQWKWVGDWLLWTDKLQFTVFLAGPVNKKK